MPIRNQVIALIVGFGMFFLIIDLVRRRKLKEEYSWLWLITAVVILVFSLWFKLLKWTTYLIGAIAPSSTIFLFAFLFLVLISLHFSIVISNLSNRNKELAQQFAILELEYREIVKKIDSQFKKESSEIGKS